MGDLRLKPSNEFNEPLTQRRAVLGKKSILYRYPRTCNVIGMGLAMCILFSKPIYDIFFAKYPEFDFSEPEPRKRVNN